MFLRLLRLLSIIMVSYLWRFSILPFCLNHSNSKTFSLSSISKNKKLTLVSLRKKCPYSEFLWSAFFPHFPAFGLNTEYLSVFRLNTEYLSVFSPNAGKCGENADQKNSEYGHFLCSILLFWIYKYIHNSDKNYLRNICKVVCVTDQNF